MARLGKSDIVKSECMIIEVYSVTDSNISKIYGDAVDVIDSIDGVQFTVYKPNHESYRFDYDKYGWKELTPDEAMVHGIYVEENENLKYKLIVDNSSEYGMVCNNCERIIFIMPKIGESVEVSPNNLSELDWININGIKFRREK